MSDHTDTPKKHRLAASIAETQPAIRALPAIGFLTTKDLVRDPDHPDRLSIFPFGKSTLWEKIKRGEFPPPDVRLSATMVAWKVETIRAEVERLGRQEYDHDASSTEKRARRLGQKEAA